MKRAEPLAVVTESVSWKKDVSIVRQIAGPVRGHVAWTMERPVVRTLRSWSVFVLPIQDVAIRPGTLFALQWLISVAAVMAPAVMPMRLPDVQLRKRKSVFVNKAPNVARLPGMRVVPPWRR